MKFPGSFCCFAAAALLSLAVNGCGSNPSRTQRGDVLNDKVTAERVKVALEHGGKDFQQVQVQAMGADAVMLSGSVPTSQAKARAEKLARSVYRVQRVDNEVEVRVGR
jgi:osmotically-inducible protein OsmY